MNQTGWADFRTAKREAGALAAQYFVALSMPVPGADPSASRPAHLAYQARLEREGRILMAGPLSTPDGAHPAGGGLTVYRAESHAEACALADADPMHSSGARRYEMRAWLVNEGMLRIDVALTGLSPGGLR